MNSSGLVTAVANGPVTISAETGGVSGSASVTVELQVASVVVAPQGAAISGVGATTRFTATAGDESGNRLPDGAITWTSQNPAVATIDEDGTATAVASGQAVIEASASGFVGYALVTVSVPGGPPASSWDFEIPPAWPLQAVWGSSETDIYAVGDAGTIRHYDGTAWSPMTSGTSETLRGVWGTSANDIYSVGGKGTILHYDGTAWSAMTSGTTEDLNGVWGTSASDIYAVGGTHKSGRGNAIKRVNTLLEMALGWMIMNENAKDTERGDTPFLDYLEELRWRLIRALGGGLDSSDRNADSPWSE